MEALITSSPHNNPYPQPTLTHLFIFSTQTLLRKVMHNPRNEFSHTVDYRNESYGNWGAADFGRNLAQDYENHRNLNNQGVQFRHNQVTEEDDSGVFSPPLWKNGPSSPKSPSHPLLHQQNYRVYSPNSRAQAIARGQWELMEMVKSMPESSYELSLKDLVEHHRIETQNQDQDQAERLNKERNHGIRGLHQRSKKNEKMIRNGSFDNRGLFIKMGFPTFWKSKKKKSVVKNSSGKVSPKPEGSFDKDWWMKRFSGSSDSDSSRSKTGSSGSTGCGSGGSLRKDSSRKRNGFLSSCWPCFQSRRNKPEE